MNNLVIPKELFTSFNDVTFYEEPHKYFIDKKIYISVTTLIHEYVEPFQENYWSQIKANQYGLTQTQVKRAWKFINKKGTMKGTMIHDYSENLINCKKFSYPKKEVIKKFGFDPILPEYEYTKKLVDKFHADIKGKLIPISTEQIVYDKKVKIAGMFDILYWNIRAQEFQIWDNKTNKKLTKKGEGERNLLNKLSLLEETDLEIYSLQLEMYKQIIQRNTSIKLGKSYIVWFSHNNDEYKIIPINDRKYYIDIMFEERINSLAA